MALVQEAVCSLNMVLDHASVLLLELLADVGAVHG